MKMVSVATAKAHLSSLLDAAAAGEEITITRHGKPIAKLAAVEPRKKQWRSFADIRAKFSPWPRASVELIREMRDEDDARFDFLHDLKPKK